MSTPSLHTVRSPFESFFSKVRSILHVNENWFDAVLYALAALFALVVAFGSKIPLYREWGQITIAPYLVAALAAGLLAMLAQGRPLMRWRMLLAALVVIGAVIVPMACEVNWRFTITPQSLHVQPEVVVIERAANLVAHGHDPYQAHVVNGQLEGAAPGLPAYEAFFPYRPAMVVFGLPAATSLPHQFTDARIVFFLVALLVVLVALWKSPGSANRRLRTFQVALVLPWAALAIATGGDDLPIVALLLAGMIVAQRRRPGWSGIVFGVACAMKFTAWPVAALALFAARDQKAIRRPWRMSAGIAVIVVPLVLAALLINAQTFGANVIEFPLGLSGIASPAGSALPGHLLVTAFPAIRKEFVATCVVVGAASLLWYLWKRPPRDVREVCRVAGWSLVIAILLAPATRIGYLIYPLNLFVWSWMLTPPDDTATNDGLLSPNDYASAEA